MREEETRNVGDGVEAQRWAFSRALELEEERAEFDLGALGRGIDVSAHQGAIDWDRVKAAGIAFALLKATEGETYKDRLFDFNSSEVRRTKLLRGAYHFLRPKRDPRVQAEFYLATATLARGEVRPIVDVEWSFNSQGNDEWDELALAERLSVVVAWLRRAKQITGTNPIIYTSSGFWRDKMADAVSYDGLNFGDYPLWVAHYGVATPKLPKAWIAWNLWQYTDKGKVDGIATNVDLDAHQGDASEIVIP